MVLAFFVPSLQDQWDRFRARQVIERHVEMGRHLVDEGHYRLAAAAFAKAFELSESHRLDIERARLEATVLQINEEPLWDVKNPEGLQEEDFLYLIDLQRASAPPRPKICGNASRGSARMSTQQNRQPSPKTDFEPHDPM